MGGISEKLPELMSLPSRERGLKSSGQITIVTLCPVAPFAGAWIEIHDTRQPARSMFSSLPSRERGLKSKPERKRGLEKSVAPFAGAWIEIN